MSTRDSEFLGRCFLAILITLTLTGDLHARRQSRVLVVANSNSQASQHIARRYCELRKLPEWQLVSMPFASRKTMSDAEFADLGQAIPDSADVVAFSFDVPYRLGKRSVSAALIGGPHHWYQSQIPFERAVDLGGRRILPSTYLSAYNVHDAERMLTDAQVHYPDPKQAGVFYFCSGVGPRGLRNPQNKAGMDLVRDLGGRAVFAPSHSLADKSDILWQMTGFPTLKLSDGYLPGSIVDNMTSLGGFLRDPRSQSTVHDFVRAGASAGYGCVREPYARWQRFANSAHAAHYLSGAPLFETYLRTVLDWEMGLVVGDPLMAPFAKPLTLTLTRKGRSLTMLAIGKDVLRAELWANDQKLLARVSARPPAGTPLRITLLAGRQTLLHKELRADGRRGAAEQLAEIQLPGHVELWALGRCKDKLMLRLKPTRTQLTGKPILRVEVGTSRLETPLTVRQTFAEALLPVHWSVGGLRKTLPVLDGPLTLVAWDAQGQEAVYQVGFPPIERPQRPLDSDLQVSREGDIITLSGPFLHPELQVFDGDTQLTVRPHARFSHTLLVDSDASTLRLVGNAGEAEAVIEIEIGR